MILSEDHRAVQDAVRAYVQDQIAPKAAEWDKSHHFPAAELKGLAELGCYGVAVPHEYDGAGLDYLALAIILEEIGAGDGATKAFSLRTPSIVMLRSIRASVCVKDSVTVSVRTPLLPR